MGRERILKSPGYWITQIQITLYNCAMAFMKDNNKNRTQLAEHLGVTKGYVTQLLNGEYDHKLSKLVRLALAFGYVPKIDFIPINEYCKQEKEYGRTYKADVIKINIMDRTSGFSPLPDNYSKNAA